MPRQAIYDEIELEDMSYDASKDLFHYPCPCGDRFEITRQQLRDAEDIARCPSCSLLIRVVFDPLDFEEDDDADQTAAQQVTSEGIATAVASAA
ncbi:zf-CSL-domain-containing protein [Tilletiaria anomala UBC 951]|uniref:Diphthamide biosynthesis protein 3 n=1 Tax=Tilletiaria anomala (strain ATCC 24038 / CBS 436.72 / UBC 951) TaxID=1037660 RepID=A0A066VPK1_TILAU|nr:zf-CSL-domain-containing protein [Tilletiaria anomala UBC 951]KDN40510.1 zf-CSL-domain-containing protein [Tilletiaria anomala UBC 951]